MLSQLGIYSLYQSLEAYAYLYKETSMIRNTHSICNSRLNIT